MLIPLGALKPSPWNPKEPFTKKQLAALKKSVQVFGFQRSLCVCRDFQTGEGFFVLDGNTALDILKETGKKKIDCHVVEKVTDEKTLQQFMAGYSLNKRPIYSEFADVLGKIEFTDFTGLDFGKFSFDVNIDKISEDFSSVSVPENEGQGPENSKKSKTTGGNTEERQTQFFLVLPPDCIERLRNFVKTKAFNSDKTDAIIKKIDSMNDTQFLGNILQIIL